MLGLMLIRTSCCRATRKKCLETRGISLGRWRRILKPWTGPRHTKSSSLILILRLISNPASSPAPSTRRGYVSTSEFKYPSLMFQCDCDLFEFFENRRSLSTLLMKYYIMFICLYLNVKIHGSLEWKELLLSFKNFSWVQNIERITNAFVGNNFIKICIFI